MERHALKDCLVPLSRAYYLFVFFLNPITCYGDVVAVLAVVVIGVVVVEVVNSVVVVVVLVLVGVVVVVAVLDGRLLDNFCA